MSKPIFSDEALLDWLKTKDPKELYNFNSQKCVICQYLKDHGIAFGFLSTSRINFAFREPIFLSDGWKCAAAGNTTGYPSLRKIKWDGNYWSTFGEAAERLETYCGTK